MSGNRLGGIIGRTLGLLCATAALAACNDGSSSGSASASGAQTVTVAANTAYNFHPQTGASTAPYSIERKPGWASFNSMTGELSGTPTNADTGQYANIIISAEANGSPVAMPPLSIIVTPATAGRGAIAHPAASTGANATGPSTTSSEGSGSSGGTGSSSGSSNGSQVASSNSSVAAAGSGKSGTGKSGSGSNGTSGATGSSGSSASSGSSGSASSSGSTSNANGSITLAWDAPTENTNGSALTNLAGFQILYGTSSTSLTQKISINSVGILNYVIENLTPGTWYFEVVAVNSAGETSSPSSLVSVTI